MLCCVSSQQVSGVRLTPASKEAGNGLWRGRGQEGGLGRGERLSNIDNFTFFAFQEMIHDIIFPLPK